MSQKDRQALLQELEKALSEANRHRANAKALAMGADGSDRPQEVREAAEVAGRLAEEAQSRAATLQEEHDSLPAPKPAEKAKAERDRAWYLPGSVAEDPGLQLSEAQRGGILELAALYAGRSLYEAARTGEVHEDSIAGKLAGAAQRGHELFREAFKDDHATQPQEPEPEMEPEI